MAAPGAPPTETPSTSRSGPPAWVAVLVLGVLLASVILAWTLGPTPQTTSEGASATSTAPTTTASLASPTRISPSYLPPELHEGHGDDVITTSWPAKLGIVTFECAGCTRNTVLKSDGRESLLVNEIGSYRGTRWINVRDGSFTTTFTIKATGPWRLSITDLDQVKWFGSGETVSGEGDDVILLAGGSRRATITNQGEHNFAVHVLSPGAGLDLAVNEIGGYRGTVPLREPALVQITSSGHWTIERL
ncbi:hypothetical protein GCM10012275_54860 [Longimycelium tulufanense]|uniref:Uncharacterized protein n=1 Tax=Longimycelium tulufanense TaxID=907463 RepID=A0A8J3FYN1_9PSEU|nr:hypothetical protein [Longimycelium tulufanense]GGM77253.1 hypothetical protein GCM10012275_54860 [Longimycelium tulufanense]